MHGIIFRQEDFDGDLHIYDSIIAPYHITKRMSFIKSAPPGVAEVLGVQVHQRFPWLHASMEV